MPSADWQPLERLPAEGTGATVWFIAESTGKSKEFAFDHFSLEPELARWFARAFLRRVGPRGGIKRIKSAESLYAATRQFALSLAEADVPISGPGRVMPAHIKAFLLQNAGTRMFRHNLLLLRSLLRAHPELPKPTREALFSVRLPELKKQEFRDAYAPSDTQRIMTAVRHDVRRARDRITAGRALLASFRAGDLPPGSRAELTGRFLDQFDRTGTWPAPTGRTEYKQFTKAGGLAGIANGLCLTPDEAVSFCMLLTALTSENFGTVAEWPIAHYRPDGGHGALALIEENKPRRGPERQHMIRPLESVPGALADILASGDDEDRLFLSPLRLYLLLLDLTETSRRLAGHVSPFSAFLVNCGRFGDHWCEGILEHQAKRWAKRRGFPPATEQEKLRRDAEPGRPPSVDVRRLRQTAIESRRRPVAQTRATMNDIYLRNSRTVQADSTSIVADALRGQVAKAQVRTAVTVFTPEFLEFALRDPERAAAEAGLDPTALKELIAGERDTVVTGCTDHRAGPHAPPGQPCPVSFIECLNCENARALPHQLPVQIETRDRIRGLRSHLPRMEWQARYEAAADQLDDVIGKYSKAEQDNARCDLDPQQRLLVDDLLAGRLDLR
jgi:hypothetical protein